MIKDNWIEKGCYAVGAMMASCPMIANIQGLPIIEDGKPMRDINGWKFGLSTIGQDVVIVRPHDAKVYGIALELYGIKLKKRCESWDLFRHPEGGLMKRRLEIPRLALPLLLLILDLLPEGIHKTPDKQYTPLTISKLDLLTGLCLKPYLGKRRILRVRSAIYFLQAVSVTQELGPRVGRVKVHMIERTEWTGRSEALQIWLDPIFCNEMGKLYAAPERAVS